MSIAENAMSIESGHKMSPSGLSPLQTQLYDGYATAVITLLAQLASTCSQSSAVGAVGSFLVAEGVIQNRTQLASCFTIAMLTSALILLHIGSQIDKRGGRFVFLNMIVGLACACFFTGLVVTGKYGTTYGIFTLFCAFLLLRIFGQGGLTLVCMNLVNFWFNGRRRAQVTACINLIFLFASQGVLEAWLRKSCEIRGWRSTFIMTGQAILLILGGLGWYFVKDVPKCETATIGDIASEEKTAAATGSRKSDRVEEGCDSCSNRNIRSGTECGGYASEKRDHAASTAVEGNNNVDGLARLSGGGATDLNGITIVGDYGAAAAASQNCNYTLAEARKTTLFWTILGTCFFIAVAETGFWFNVDRIFVSSQFPTTTNPLVYYVYAGSSFGAAAGSLFMGTVEPKNYVKFVGLLALLQGCVVTFAPHVIGWSGSMHPIITGLLVSIGFAKGCITGSLSVVESVAYSHFFGSKFNGSIQAFCNAVILVSSASGPVVLDLLINMFRRDENNVKYGCFLSGLPALIVAALILSQHEKLSARDLAGGYESRGAS